MDPRLLVLVSLAVVAFTTPMAQAAAVPCSHVHFDLATETYADFHTKLNATLHNASYPRHVPSDVYGRAVLAERRAGFRAAPRRWVMAHLRVGREAATTLAVAPDDLYIIGFMNGAGQWFVLGGGGGGDNPNLKFKGLPPDSVALPFGANYAELLGRGGHELLYTVPLGNRSAVEAVRTLAGYDPAAVRDEEIRGAFARLVVMVTEAMRFRVIREAFSQRWDLETFMLREHAKYVVHWAKLSSLLLDWERSGWQDWGGPLADAVARIGIYRPNDAWQIVDFLLRPQIRPISD